MSSRLWIALATVVFALLYSTNVRTARAQQKPHTSDQKEVVDTVSALVTAASTEDIAKFDSVIASDFHIFANGTRFNGDAIMGVIKALHAAGKRYDEHVIEPDSTSAPISGGSPTSIRQHHRRLWHYESAMAGIGLPGETERRLEDRLYAQYPRPHAAPRNHGTTAKL